jgi:two-component system sensor histidine kinase TtrS
MWGPTAAYLSEAVPDHSFSIIPLDFQEIGSAVERRKVDFVLANTSIYVQLEAQYGVSRIATLMNKSPRGTFKVFGGVIFCRADRADIKELRDLKGKSFAAVDETSLGGWQVAWRELKDHGIDPSRHFARFTFDGTHDAVVYAVRDGSADAGTVRTDTLERMAEDGRIDLARFRILNPRKHEQFPFALSTRLYPEWPFAKARHTGDDLARKVAVALLDLSPDSPAARAGRISGWTIPLDYQPVHEIMKELRVGPYRDYGKVPFGAAVRLYWRWVLLAAGAVMTMAFVTVHVGRLNRRLRISRKELEQARAGLEEQVRERTAVLEQQHAELIEEVRQRAKAESEREEARQFLQSVIDGVDEAIMVIRPDCRVVLMNREAKELTLAGSFCYEILHHRNAPCGEQEPSCPLRTVLLTKQPVTITHAHRKKDGSEYHVEILASPVLDKNGELAYVIEACRDVTEKLELEAMRSKMQERLFHQQKEQSIITLAGGIAHDFNNILMGVVGTAEVLKMQYPPTGKQHELVNTIVDLAKRMAHLTRQLLAYAKQGAYEQKAISLNDTVRDAVALAHKGAAVAVSVQTDLAEGLWPVFADPVQLSQVLVNLLTNAFEALEATGGSVIVKTANVERRQAWECGLNQHHAGGDYVHLSVSDTGPGITPDVQRRIFEPFFSTKFLGRGLGLAAAAGIIQNHNGCIMVESAPGSGSVFHIFLTRHHAAPAGQARRNVAPAGKILVVEDEPQILSLLRMMLDELGFEAILARGGASALPLFRRSSGDIVMAIIDIQMPGMDGKQLLRELKGLKPELKVLISSGFDEKTAFRGIDPGQVDGFIQKPYWIDALREKIQKMMGGEGRSVHSS